MTDDNIRPRGCLDTNRPIPPLPAWFIASASFRWRSLTVLRTNYSLQDRLIFLHKEVAQIERLSMKQPFRFSPILNNIMQLLIIIRLLSLDNRIQFSFEFLDTEVLSFHSFYTIFSRIILILNLLASYATI